jgi:hypothetical protein
MRKEKSDLKHGEKETCRARLVFVDKTPPIFGDFLVKKSIGDGVWEKFLHEKWW